MKLVAVPHEKLSDLRRELYSQLADTMQKDVLKGVRWLLLKRPEHLDASRREPERLREALRLNEPLAIAYHLKMAPTVDRMAVSTAIRDVKLSPPCWATCSTS